MKIRNLSLALAALFGVTGAALAQPNDPPNMVPGNQAYYNEHPWEVYGGPYDRRWYRDRNQDYQQNRLPGVGPGRDLRIGQRLAPGYRSRQYAVEDWRGHRLLAPPRGYGWYQVGADYVLIEMATGIIAQAMRAR